MEVYNELKHKYDKISTQLWQKWHLRNSKYNDRLNAFAKLLKPGGKFLDLGCGFGRDVLYFKELGFDTYGIDISSNMINLGFEKYGELNLYQGNILKASNIIDKKFDAIWCRGVLFHFDIGELTKVIHEIEELTEHNSYVYIQINRNSSYKEHLPISDTEETSDYYFHQLSNFQSIFSRSFHLVRDLSDPNYLSLIYAKN